MKNGRRRMRHPGPRTTGAAQPVSFHWQPKPSRVDQEDRPRRRGEDRQRTR